jgi:hypothetical protein
VRCDGQGLPQYIQLSFPSPVIPKRISITFQGGFVGTRCTLQVVPLSAENGWHILTQIYPEDVNRQQSFDIIPIESALLEGGINMLKLVFEESSDFFGRITVYDLEIDGVSV